MPAEGFIDLAALERSLSALKERAGEDGLMEAVQLVLEGARQLFKATGAGFMMVDESSALQAVAATDEPGRLLEERQGHVGHGPCVDALTLDRVVITTDLGADDRWPELRPELPDLGVRSVLGVPIHVSGLAVGSLNLYRDQPGDWHAAEVGALEAYGGLIGSLLRGALQSREHERLAQQLQHALDNRIVIERAVGAIMGRDRIDAVAAFNRLRETARSTQRKVSDAAAELLSEIGGR